tara:strand:- start:1800 stop:2249 length:450 start_codon:yes stop_codon:yes gene_type:complete
MRITPLLIAIVILFSGCGNTDEDYDKLSLNSRVETLINPAQEKVENWPAYVAFDNNMRIISNTNALNAIGLMDQMIVNINAMPLQVPDELSTEELLESIKEVDHEVQDFYSEVDRNELHEHVVQSHIIDILNAYDDLNKEINSTTSKQI